LKDNGLLVFTYHHSRAEGWTSIMEADSAQLVYVERIPFKPRGRLLHRSLKPKSQPLDISLSQEKERNNVPLERLNSRRIIQGAFHS